MIGLVGTLLLLSALLLRFSRSLNQRMRIGLLVAGVVACFVPVFNTNLHQYLFGVLGQLSIITLWLLCRFIITELKLVSYSPTPPSLHLFIVIFASALYLSSLGLSMQALYSWGYQPLILIVVLTGVAGWALWQKQFALCQAITLSLLAYAFNLLASLNLWDYLFDPLLLIFAAYRLLLVLFKGKPLHA